jgi:pyridoxamine 5'-phosphate oxidase
VPSDPVRQFVRWFRRAQRAGTPLAEAVALATTSRTGAPSVRMVLLKGVDARGFVFFTDARSRKGSDLRANPRAALAFHWQRLGRQVRIAGRVTPVSAAEADAYWETRPRASRLAASVSHQSAPLASRALLLARWRALARRTGAGPIPRPATWTGFRVVPEEIEFWTHQAHRLHHRELFVRARRRWTRRLLQP